MKKRVFNLIIVDESGSMQIIRKQALSGMNETLQTVIGMQKKFTDIEQRVTLLTFDSNHTTYHFDNAEALKVRTLKWNQYNPCAATPLYDAIGKAVSRLNALTAKDDKVLVTIITDGEENSSTEWTLSMVRTLIEKLKRQNWTFSLIGTDNLDVESMARTMAIDEHMEFQQDDAGTREMFRRERVARMRYNECYAADCEVPVGSLFRKDD